MDSPSRPDDGASPAELTPFTDGWDYPLAVVTAAAGDPAERSGCLVGFLTQCSIDPVRFLVCLSRTNHTFRVAARADVLAVHALAAHQRPLAELFGAQTGDEVDKFSRCRWRPGPHGVPLLADCPRFFVGGIRDRIELGDHTGYLLEPIRAAGEPGPPGLMFSQVKDLDPGHPA
jgi:flavin reductase (DIM6/NTAB) family NADH-FMN oxidoreductase RutF